VEAGAGAAEAQHVRQSAADRGAHWPRGDWGLGVGESGESRPEFLYGWGAVVLVCAAAFLGVLVAFPLDWLYRQFDSILVSGGVSWDARVALLYWARVAAVVAFWLTVYRLGPIKRGSQSVGNWRELGRKSLAYGFASAPLFFYVGGGPTELLDAARLYFGTAWPYTLALFVVLAVVLGAPRLRRNGRSGPTIPKGSSG
jgi:hypothetical protein